MEGEHSFFTEVARLSDDELNSEIARHLGLKHTPTMRRVLDRLREAHGVDTKLEPVEDKSAEDNAYRVSISPPAWRRISITAPTQARAIRIALLVWLRNDPSSTEILKRALKLS